MPFNQDLPNPFATPPVRARQMTTAQRTAFNAVNGDIVYDTTIGEFFKYEGGGWVKFTTKELFSPASFSTAGISNIGDFQTYLVTGNSGEICRIHPFRLPNDYQNAVGYGIVLIPVTAGRIRYAVDSDMGAVGEAYNTHSNNEAVDINPVVANEITVQITGALTLGLAGDYVGITITEGGNAGDENFHVLGFALIYV